MELDGLAKLLIQQDSETKKKKNQYCIHIIKHDSYLKYTTVNYTNNGKRQP